MALVVNGRTGVPRFQDFEHRRPMMLKDFLGDNGYCNSCSAASSGFRRSARNKSGRSTAVIHSGNPSIVLLRSRSKRAAATTISAIQKVINVVKFFHFESTKPAAVQHHRSSSRKLGDSAAAAAAAVAEDMVKVKVKDILRWRSFRDLEEDGSAPLDVPTSSNPTATTSSSSKMSSWCDSDFTADDEEELPDLWGYRNEKFLGKKSCIGQPTNPALGNLKEDWSTEESEQQSPVSVLYSPFREVEEFTNPFRPNASSRFDSSSAGPKCVLTRRFNYQEHECTSDTKTAYTSNFVGEEMKAAEEKAMQLLSQIAVPEECHNLLLDFFMGEIMSMNGKALVDGDEFDSKILRAAKSWENGEIEDSYQWELEDKRKAYVEDMEKGTSWIRFNQEHEEISRELESEVLDEFLDNLLADFLGR